MIHDSFIIKQAPSKALYIPNFISEEEENITLEKLYAAPKPKWVHLSNRRLQNWGGLPHPKGMVAEPLPTWLKRHMTKIDELKLFDGNLTNHVLVNEYLPGQGIMPHEDGPLFYPTITTINLGSDILLDLYEPTEKEGLDEGPSENNAKDSKCEGIIKDRELRCIGSLLLEPRSLLVLQDDLYTRYLHGICQKEMDTLDKSVLNIGMTSRKCGEVLRRKTRVSLTIRYFPKVLKCKIFCSR